jgi:Asp-tRNA(Asn)/Glu-tRNA(Gln) amidotransferase A subunit family amidase
MVGGRLIPVQQLCVTWPQRHRPARRLAPLHWTKDGLPVGVPFVARFGDEATLLRVASQIEDASPRRDRRPLTVV